MILGLKEIKFLLNSLDGFHDIELEGTLTRRTRRRTGAARNLREKKESVKKAIKKYTMIVVYKFIGSGDKIVSISPPPAKR